MQTRARSQADFPYSFVLSEPQAMKATAGKYFFSDPFGVSVAFQKRPGSRGRAPVALCRERNTSSLASRDSLPQGLCLTWSIRLPTVVEFDSPYISFDSFSLGDTLGMRSGRARRKTSAGNIRASIAML